MEQTKEMKETKEILKQLKQKLGALQSLYFNQNEKNNLFYLNSISFLTQAIDILDGTMGERSILQQWIKRIENLQDEMTNQIFNNKDRLKIMKADTDLFSANEILKQLKGNVDG